MFARVILGEKKLVNTEAPRSIIGVKSFECGTVMENIRSFKWHKWAYTKSALLKVLQQMEATI